MVLLRVAGVRFFEMDYNRGHLLRGKKKIGGQSRTKTESGTRAKREVKHRIQMKQVIVEKTN